MENAQLSNIIVQLKSQGQMDFLPSVTNAEIGAFEVNNKVYLPIQYREWLMFSDGGELFLPAGIQLYGIAHQPIINVNDSGSPNEEYIVIGTMSSGDPIICERGREVISIYNSEAGKIESDETFADFYEFISNLSEVLVTRR